MPQGEAVNFVDEGLDGFRGRGRDCFGLGEANLQDGEFIIGEIEGRHRFLSFPYWLGYTMMVVDGAQPPDKTG